MKRRGFIASLAGLCAVPAVAMLPKDERIVLYPADPGPEHEWATMGGEPEIITNCSFAEFQQARMRAIVAAAVEHPLSHDEICELFECDWSRCEYIAHDGARLVPHIQGEYSA